MKVLVIGAGGREHAFVWKAAQSPLVSEVLVAPGNAGTALEPKARNVAIAADDLDGLLALVRREDVELVIVGPEQPLVSGAADRFEQAGVKCFGPRLAAARLEGSKAFAKAFLARHGIPTAAYQRFDDLDAALSYVRARGAPIVIKADGLAAGKGVVVAQSVAEAQTALTSMLAHRSFGDAGTTVVVEEFLAGEEASFIAMVDGTCVLPLASSQDHKRRDDGDRGPNTGGMGAYSPAPVVTPAMHERIMNEVMRPAVRGLAREGLHYRGFLYAGIMIDDRGTPQVLEFNVRCGDPETQPIMVRLRSDLIELVLRSFDGTLEDGAVEWDPRTAVGVVMASAGYPASYEKGLPISGLDDVHDDTVKVFHAGTRFANGQVVTDGGRVLCVVGLGNDVSQARDRAYRAVETIEWQGAFCRRDIAHRALARNARQG